MIFLAITLFWVTMNVLLWRAEFGTRDPAGSPVPVDVVWRKILTAPDSSSLSILKDGKRVGFCHVVTSVGEEFAKLDETPPEGMVEKVKNYVIKFDGNVALSEYGVRLRFDLLLRLSTNRTWQEFDLRLSSRPVMWEFRALAAEQALRFRAEDGETSMERTIRFSDLHNPQAWLGQMAGGLSLPFLGAMGLRPQSGESMSLGWQWRGNMEHIRMGHEPVRVYRLRTRLLDKYDVSVWVSRAGEILRAELPEGVVLLHDQLGGSSAGL